MTRHRQITRLDPHFVRKKLDDFFKEDNISEDITTVATHEKNKEVQKERKRGRGKEKAGKRARGGEEDTKPNRKKQEQNPTPTNTYTKQEQEHGKEIKGKSKVMRM